MIDWFTVAGIVGGLVIGWLFGKYGPSGVISKIESDITALKTDMTNVKTTLTGTGTPNVPAH